MTISIFASVTCGILLVAIVGAFIFSPIFRRDLLANSDAASAKIFGVLSVRGALIVAMMAVLICGLLYPIFGQKQERYLMDINTKLTQQRDRIQSEMEQFKHQAKICADSLSDTENLLKVANEKLSSREVVSEWSQPNLASTIKRLDELYKFLNDLG